MLLNSGESTSRTQPDDTIRKILVDNPGDSWRSRRRDSANLGATQGLTAGGWQPVANRGWIHRLLPLKWVIDHEVCPDATRLG